MNKAFSNALHAIMGYSIQKEERSLGLVNGAMGVVVINFILAKFMDDDEFTKKGINLLDLISDNISEIHDINLENGLLGIGWSIEWLVQNKLLDNVNTDEILEEIDSLIYRDVIYSRDNEFSLLKGALGKIRYLHRRELSRNPGSHALRRVCHQECLVLLTDDLLEHVIEKTRNKQFQDLCKSICLNESKKTLIDFGNAVIQIVAISNINYPTVESIVYETIRFIDKCIFELTIGLKQGKYNLDGESYISALYVSTCYLIAGNLFAKKYWVNRALELITELWLLKPNFQKVLKRDPNWFSLINLMQPNIPELDFDDLGDLLTCPLTDDISLSGKLGSLLVSEIQKKDPSLVKEWHELIFFK